MGCFWTLNSCPLGNHLWSKRRHSCTLVIRGLGYHNALLGGAAPQDHLELCPACSTAACTFTRTTRDSRDAPVLRKLHPWPVLPPRPFYSLDVLDLTRASRSAAPKGTCLRKLPATRPCPTTVATLQTLHTHTHTPHTNCPPSREKSDTFTPRKPSQFGEMRRGGFPS